MISLLVAAAAALILAAADVGETVGDYQVRASDTPGTGVVGEQRFTAPGLSGEAFVRPVWLPTSRKDARLCWEVLFTVRSRGEMFRLLIDAQNGGVIPRFRRRWNRVEVGRDVPGGRARRSDLQSRRRLTHQEGDQEAGTQCPGCPHSIPAPLTTFGCLRPSSTPVDDASHRANHTHIPPPNSAHIVRAIYREASQ